MKLEIESDKVDNLQDFRAKKHIHGVRLHFIPESYDGTQALYDGITFEKDNSPLHASPRRGRLLSIDKVSG